MNAVPWYLGRLAGFDTETSGLDVEQDRIVTACVVQCGAGRPTQTATWLADPGVEIPEAASRIHKVTTERAQAEGTPAAEVVEQVVAALAQVARDGIPIVAMNATFDLTLLDREARRHGVTPLADIIGRDDLRVIDPMVIDRKLSRRRGKRTLADLCKHYEVRLDRAHTADADAIAACRVVYRLGQRYATLHRLDLRGLHLLQTSWAADLADQRRAWLIGQGRHEDAKSVRSEWPLVPFAAEGVAS